MGDPGDGIGWGGGRGKLGPALRPYLVTYFICGLRVDIFISFYSVYFGLFIVYFILLGEL